MEITAIELKHVERVVTKAAELDEVIRELADLELALVGGGVGDVEF